MSSSEVYERVEKILCTHLKIDAQSVEPQTRLIEDLQIDSLFINELILSLEDEFDILVDDDVPLLTTVDSIVQFVSQELREK